MSTRRSEANRVPQPPAPPGWGGDHLTKLLDLLRNNMYASFVLGTDEAKVVGSEFGGVTTQFP